MPNDILPRAPLLAETIAERLIEDIALGKIELGANLSENRVADRYGTSKTPVREAFLRLQSLGLVEILPQRGARVFSPSRKMVTELSEFRLLLETGALAAVHGTDCQDLGQRLAEIVLRMEEVFSLEDPFAYQSLDGTFHLEIIKASKNTFLFDAYQHLATKIAALRTELSSPQPYLLEKSLEEHRSIAQRLLSGSTSYPIEVLRDHIRRTTEFHLRQIVETEQEQPMR